MSINGVLEDLPLADVVQFVHIGRRTGTLYLWRDDRDRAEIGFFNGRIVSTWRPEREPLGDQLVAEGLVDSTALQAALAEQQQRVEQRSIGQILVDRGALRKADLYRLLKVQITDTIFELVTWDRGRFHFEVDELNLLDDFAIDPQELLEDLDLNTQMLLLEATRIFDERQQRKRERRGTEAKEPAALGLRGREGASAEASDAAASDSLTGTRPMPAIPDTPSPVVALRCQVVSDDADLVPALRDEVPEPLARVVGVSLHEAGNKLPGDSVSPLVVLDLRAGADRAQLPQLARTRPAAPVIALVASPDAAGAAYRAGAVAAVSEISELAHACRSLVRVLSHPQPHGAFGFGTHAGFGRFRRVVYEVQSGLISATMALNLMHVISESVERAVLFLVRGRRMVAVGAFGFAGDGRALAEAARALRLEPSDKSALRRACVEGQPVVAPFSDAHLPPQFAAMIGAPASGQAVIFPVLGAQRAISVIYTDNGALDEAIQDIRILELATAQVGVALENELMQQELADQGLATWLDGTDLRRDIQL